MSIKSLQHLIHNVVSIDDDWNRKISHLSLDSREVKKDTLFFALKGTHKDGREYIDDAINNGASAILADCDIETKNELRPHKRKLIPIIYIKNLKQTVGVIASTFYNDPSKEMTIIAATGTNGKTSCCHFLAQALASLDNKVAVLGTIGNGLWGKHKKSELTTLDALSLQLQLSQFVKQGVTHVILEASSHGLSQGRLNGINFDLAVFTNLSRDHLDYHGDMQHYAKAKRILFDFPSVHTLVINIDDDFGRQLVESYHPAKKVYAYSASGRLSEQAVPLTRAHQVHLNLEGLTTSVHSQWGDGLLHTRLLGRFNLSNLLAVFNCLGILSYGIDEIMNCMAKINPVAGRMQLFGGDNKPYVIVDFAHTPDALRQVLNTLKEYCQQELWCVFGCGGNRDQGKRSEMGQIAESIADHVILTDDNPRDEAPHAIAADILQGMNNPEYAVIEHDRRRAISHAINCAQVGDIIVIAGKGHESYQQYNNEKLPFNDELEVQMILAEYQND